MFPQNFRGNSKFPKMKTEENRIIPMHSAKEPLSVESLRTFNGFENISDDEANDVIISLRAFAALVFDYCNLKQKSKVININPSNQKQAA